MKKELNNKKDIWKLQSEIGMAISAEDHPTDWQELLRTEWWSACCNELYLVNKKQKFLTLSNTIMLQTIYNKCLHTHIVMWLSDYRQGLDR
jgi:hypothetical protein